MTAFERSLDAWLTREEPAYPCRDCGGTLDESNGACAGCDAERAALDEAAGDEAEMDAMCALRAHRDGQYRTLVDLWATVGREIERRLGRQVAA